MVEEIAESLGKNEEKESEDASAAAGLMEKLTVSESKSEVNPTTEVPVAADEKKEEEKSKKETKAEELSSAA